MDPVAMTVGISWTLAGLMCIGVSIPLICGRISRNSVYGIRLPQSLESDEAWLEINRFGGRRFVIWSIPMIVVGVVSLFLPLRTSPALTWVLGFAPLAFVFIPAIESRRFARGYRPKV